MGTECDSKSVLGLYVQERRFLPKTFAEIVQNTADLEMWIFPFLQGLENACLLDPYAGQNSRCGSVCAV